MGKHRHAVTRDHNYDDSDHEDDDYYYNAYIDKVKDSKSSQKGTSTNNIPVVPTKSEQTKPKPVMKKTKKPTLQELTSEFNKREKRTLNICIVGHVDAGKSTLLGHLLHKMYIVSTNELRKNQREAAILGRSSFAFAWCMDEMDEERERGITMDVGIVNFETPRLSINAFDTPGHVDFIPKMIEATSLADVMILIVSAVPGEFETCFADGGRTHEHVTIARSMGVGQIIVVINKMDTVKWLQSRFEEIRDKLMCYLMNVGFKNLEFIPCSAFRGHNLFDDSSLPEEAAWYREHCLLHILDGIQVERTLKDDTCRSVVVSVNKYPYKSDFVIRAVVRTGQIYEGMSLVVFPTHVGIIVKGLSVVGHSVHIGYVGDLVEFDCVNDPSVKEVSVNEITDEHISVGHVLCGDVYKTVSSFQCKIRTLKTNFPITEGFNCEMYCNGSASSVWLSKIINIIKNRKGKSIKYLSSNCTAVVEFGCLTSAFLVEYDKCKEMGRFILMSDSITLAVGVVTLLIP